MGRPLTYSDREYIRRCERAGDTLEQIVAWSGFTEIQVRWALAQPVRLASNPDGPVVRMAGAIAVQSAPAARRAV